MEMHWDVLRLWVYRAPGELLGRLSRIARWVADTDRRPNVVEP